jgi:beta-mannosidase
MYIVSDKTTPTAARLRLRVFTLEGKSLSDSWLDVQIPELSSKIYLQKPLAEFVSANGADAANIFAVTDLFVDAKSVSSNVLYLVPAKLITLPQPQISIDLAKSGEAYRLRLSSPVLARSVYISFGTLDASPSDNYFDLIPNQPVEITITSAATLDQLRAQLKITSLAEAFAPK